MITKFGSLALKTLLAFLALGPTQSQAAAPSPAVVSMVVDMRTGFYSERLYRQNIESAIDRPFHLYLGLNQGEEFRQDVTFEIESEKIAGIDSLFVTVVRKVRFEGREYDNNTETAILKPGEVAHLQFNAFTGMQFVPMTVHVRNVDGMVQKWIKGSDKREIVLTTTPDF